MPRRGSRPVEDLERVRGMAAAARRRRRELGLTQLELARYAGVGSDFVYDLEDGKPTLRFAKILDVLAALGLELRLVSGKGVLVVDEALRAPDDDGGA
jgi:HTH-type transcriptional regulator/antitoxin HipB